VVSGDEVSAKPVFKVLMFDVAYGLLIAHTVCIFLGTWVLWRRTNSLHFVLGLGLIYYYSLGGAWKIINLKWTGQESPSLDHLEDSLFPISIDENYLLTISIYGAFILAIIIFLCVLTVESPRHQQVTGLQRTIRFSHVTLTAIACLALSGSAALIWSAFTSALESGVSLYSASRGELSQFFTIHQLLNRVGVICVTIGICGALLEQRRAAWLLCYAVLAAAWVAFLGVLGNRNELLVAGVAGFLVCYAFNIRPRFVNFVLLACGAFFVMRLIELTRGTEVVGILPDLGAVIASPDFWNPFALAGGSESFAAHMSLYGIVSQNLEFTYGSSLLYLANSLLPSFIWSQRVQDSYSIYAVAVGAPETQGFNIHYAAASYLNLGLPAVVIGAAALALLWALVYRWQARTLGRSAQQFIPAVVAYSFCSAAYAPVLMRSGPEAFKGLVVEAILLPFFLTHIALRSRQRATTRDSMRSFA
jgi:hypothetical protein